MARGRIGGKESARWRGHANPLVAGDKQGLEAASAARRIANVTVQTRGSSQERR
jgi:hypothetical protein